MAIILIIALIIVGGVVYGIWMARQFGVLALWERSARRAPESLAAEDPDDRADARSRTTGRG